MKQKRSRPTSRRHQQPDAGDLADQALDHCRNIRSLASLLRAADMPSATEPLPEQTLANTASLIGKQTARLQELIHRLHERLAETSPRR